MKQLVIGLLAVAGFIACPVAQADGQQERGTVTLKTTVVVGSPHRPVAAVEVTKLAPKIRLSDLRQVFVARSEGAASHQPF